MPRGGPWWGGGGGGGLIGLGQGGPSNAPTVRVTPENAHLYGFDKIGATLNTETMGIVDPWRDPADGLGGRVPRDNRVGGTTPVGTVPQTNTGVNPFSRSPIPNGGSPVLQTNTGVNPISRSPIPQSGSTPLPGTTPPPDTQQSGQSSTTQESTIPNALQTTPLLPNALTGTGPAVNRVSEEYGPGSQNSVANALYRRYNRDFWL